MSTIDGCCVDVRLPLVGGRLRVHLSTATFNADRLVHGAEHRSFRRAGGRTSMLTLVDGNVVYIVGVFDGLLSTLIHEIDHVATMALVRAGMDPRDSDGEAHALLVGELCRLCGVDNLGMIG